MGLGTLLIRADASPEIGAGHVMRCLALAQAWQDRGGKAVFAMGQCPPLIRERLIEEKCEVLSIAGERGGVKDATNTALTAKRMGASWVVMDGAAFGAHYQARVCGDELRVLYLDDSGNSEQYHADVILNPNLSAAEGAYRNCKIGTRLLLGTRYCLLRREFLSWDRWVRAIPKTAGKVLVTLGGSPPASVARCILEGLAQIKVQITSIEFVVGTTSSGLRLGTAVGKLAGKVVFHSNSTDMATLMAQADFAISAAGCTCWELCFMGLPALLVDVADNQATEALHLQQRGCAKYLGGAPVISAEGIATQASKLSSSYETRRSFSSRCRSLVDGYGAKRVVNAMVGETSEEVEHPPQERTA